MADLDNDGQAEVIFTSWPQNGGNRIGPAPHPRARRAIQLHAVDLPAPPPATTGTAAWARPTLANIDADADLEVVVGTSSSGVVAYDLPGTANAAGLWGTGRGSLKRTGARPRPPAAAIADATVTEGNAGNTPATFAVTLAPQRDRVAVAYATSPGTARRHRLRDGLVS